MSEKPFSQACENNKDPILQIIRKVFSEPTTVWEIGSGSGQHACYFAQHLSHLIWQPTDRAENLAGINSWRDEAQLANLKTPLNLDVADEIWPCTTIEALFSANTLHIMSLTEVQILFQRLGVYLKESALLCFYGPFNYNGTYTCDSNARFDVWLKDRNPASGIKDVADISALATEIDCRIIADHAMPANNRLLVLQKG